MKYQYCTSLTDMANINRNYLEQDIDDGCWFYQLPRLENGDNMFYNDTMAELYEGRIPLWHFESNLQSLQSGVNMFKGCSLDAVSVKRIADTLPDSAAGMPTGTITLGIHCSLEGDSSVAASLTKMANKGWSIETEYNLPYGFTELEYLESAGIQYIDTGEFLDSEWSVTVTAANTAPNNDAGANGVFGHSYSAPNRFAFSLYPELSTHRMVAWIGLGDFGDSYLDWGVDSSVFHTYSLNKSMLTFDGSPVLDILTEPFTNTTYTSFLFDVNKDSHNGFIGRISSAILYQGNSKKRDFRPALDAEGTPCMFDWVSRTCFYNEGLGTFGYKVKRTGEEVAPAGITALEYLEASGTQCIETGLTVNASNGASVEWSMNTKTDYANVLSVSNADLAGRPINAGGFYVPYWNGVSAKFLAVFMDLGENNYTLDEEVQLNTKYVSNLNWLNDHKITLNNKLMGSIPEDVTSYECANPVLFGSSRNGDLLNVARLNGKIYRARISENDVVIHDFIPVLMRKTTTVAEGTTTRDVTEYIPGMYDQITGQFYENNGSGTFGYRVLHQETEVEPTTFSLRDPYYVAPSGVYARLVAENELDIVADTDMEADVADQEGYIWFANTGEAYENFGVTQQLEEWEVIDA